MTATDETFASVSGVVFDFGGVISVSPMAKWETTLYPYCESQGLPRMAVKRGFDRYRHLWDGGERSFFDVYRTIFADENLPPPTDGQLRTIWRLDAASWVDDLRADTLELMRGLKARGLKIGILSNMAPDFFAELYVPACAEYRALADAEVISGLVRLCKPDPAIYDLMRARMELPAERLLFFDDMPKNVAAARACGWRAEVYA